MAKVHFFYSTMNAGKSTALLQSNHNYKESNLKTLLFIPIEIGKKSKGKIISRIGLESDAVVVDKKYNFFKEISQSNYKKISCIFVDEAQFLSKIQVRSLSKIADELNIPIFSVDSKIFFKRITLIVEKKIIKKVFYPINDINKHIEEVLKWLKEN